MTILIDPHSGAPIYDQICRQIRDAILNGTLAAEEALPSIRNLARDLRISVITTKRAYEELEREGLIYTVPGGGRCAPSAPTRAGTAAARRLRPPAAGRARR